jgi:hypothetical protein
MKLSRFVIVLALVTAAAVLIPLRRARAAFAPCEAAHRTTPPPRGSMRRRPTRPAPPTVQVPSQRQDVSASTTTSAPRVGKARRRCVTSAATARDATRHAATPSGQSLTKASGHVAPGGDAGDCVVDAAPLHSRQDQVSSPIPAPTATAVTQAVSDVPKPPPKQASL